MKGPNAPNRNKNVGQSNVDWTPSDYRDIKDKSIRLTQSWYHFLDN